MKTLQLFNKNEKKDRMLGKYKDFTFKRNENSNFLSKREIPYFYSIKNNSVGLFKRVVVSIPSNLSELDNKYDICRIILNSYFYLNPNMTKKQLYNIFKKYSTINFFPKNFDSYKLLYDNINSIKRSDCYTITFKVIVNEISLSKDINLNIYSLDFKQYLNNWYKKNARIVYSEWLSYEVGYYFQSKINSYDISVEKIMSYFDIKDKRTIEKYLKFNNITFHKNNTVTYLDDITNELTTIKLKDIREYIIEKNIKYFIKGNKKLTIELLINESKWVDHNGVEKNISKRYIYDFLKINIELKNKINTFNKRFGEFKEVFNRIDSNDIEVSLKPIKIKNKWGKVYTETFDDFKDMFE